MRLAIHLWGPFKSNHLSPSSGPYQYLEPTTYLFKYEPWGISTPLKTNMTWENPHVQHGIFMEIHLRMVPFPRCHVRFSGGGETSQELIIPHILVHGPCQWHRCFLPSNKCQKGKTHDQWTQNDRTKNIMKTYRNISKPLGIPQQKPSLQSKNVCNLDAQIPHLIDLQQGPWWIQGLLTPTVSKRGQISSIFV